MNTITNPYDALYTNLKNRFTVVHDGRECTVGDFMLMKAGKQNNSQSTLPVAKTVKEENSLATIIHYMNEKLTVKTPPVKDSTIKRFPIRTSLSAMLSAVAACALIVSCGIFTQINTDNTAGNAPADYSVSEDAGELETHTVEDITNTIN